MTGERLHPEHDPLREQLLAELVESAPDAVLVVDADGVLRLVNHQIEVLFGYSREQLLGQPVELLVPERFRARHVLDRGRYAEAPTVRPMGEGRFLLARRGDGTEFPVEISLAPLSVPSGPAFTAIVRDVTARAELEAELARRATCDPLTGLPNRFLLADRLAVATARREPHGALLFIDLDDFKRVNDELGHGAGDTLLKTVADRLTRIVRPEDSYGRWGGDEFMVLNESLRNRAEALGLADRLATAIAEPVEIAGRVIRAQASIGVAMLEEGHDSERIINLADERMYLVKRAHLADRGGEP